MSQEPDPRKLVKEPHFRLLREFGRNTLAEKLDDKQKETLWKLSCRQAGLPFVPQDLVVEVWKEFIGGVSHRSSIVINGDVDPSLTTLGVAFDKILVATHTTRTKALLVRVFQIWRRAFPDDDAFMEAVRLAALSSLRRPKKKI